MALKFHLSQVLKVGNLAALQSSVDRGNKSFVTDEKKLKFFKKKKQSENVCLFLSQEPDSAGQ